MGEKQRLKLEIIFGSNFHFRFERYVTNTPLRQRLRCVSCFINKQRERECRASISLLSVPRWPREQRLRKFKQEGFESDEKRMESEIINCSDYKGK